GLSVGKTGPVQKGTRVQVGNLVVPDAGVWAFQTKPGTTSSVIETSLAFYVFRVDSLQPEGIPPLAQIPPPVTLAPRNDKKPLLAKDTAQASIKRLEGGAPMADAAKAMNLPYREFGPF